jgi:hypothetical protein
MQKLTAGLEQQFLQPLGCASVSAKMRSNHAPSELNWQSSGFVTIRSRDLGSREVDRILQ